MAVTGPVGRPRARPAGAQRPTALVLRALGLGDLLTAVPALRALHRGLPGHEIVLAAPEPLAALLPMVGAVDRLLPLPGLQPVRPPPAAPDVAVNLHGRGPQSHQVLKALRPGALLAFAHPAHPDVVGPRWRADEHEVDRWCRLLATYVFPADRSDLDLLPPPRRSPLPGVVVVHPGAKHAARRWPPDRFAAVAARLRADGHRVVVTGSAAERAHADVVAGAAGLPAADVLAGRTDLAVLAALVAEARLVVSGDTGVAHLATAYRTPSVVLFGPVPPAQWGPPPDRPAHVALWAGHRDSPLRDEPAPGLLEIGVPDVLAAAQRALAVADPGRGGDGHRAVASTESAVSGGGQPR